MTTPRHLHLARAKTRVNQIMNRARADANDEIHTYLTRELRRIGDQPRLLPGTQLMFDHVGGVAIVDILHRNKRIRVSDYSISIDGRPEHDPRLWRLLAPFHRLLANYHRLIEDVRVTCSTGWITL